MEEEGCWCKDLPCYHPCFLLQYLVKASLGCFGFHCSKQDEEDPKKNDDPPEQDDDPSKNGTAGDDPRVAPGKRPRPQPITPAARKAPTKPPPSPGPPGQIH